LGFLCKCKAILMDRHIQKTELFEVATDTAKDLLYWFMELDNRHWISRQRGEKHLITNPCPPYKSRPQGR